MAVSVVCNHTVYNKNDLFHLFARSHESGMPLSILLAFNNRIKPFSVDIKLHSGLQSILVNSHLQPFAGFFINWITKIVLNLYQV